MNNKYSEAREYVNQARAALRRGDPLSARQLAEQAALRAPELEDVWLVLAASDPNPQDALAYARKALELEPESARAQKAVQWASGRLDQLQLEPEQVQRTEVVRTATTGSSPGEAFSSSPSKSKRISWLYPVLLAGAGCMLVGMIALFALASPAIASIVSSVSAPAPTQENLWAPVEIAKPAFNSIDANAIAPQQADTPTRMPTRIRPTATPTDVPASTPTAVPTEEITASQTPAVTETPGVMVMEIIADTPTSEYVPPTPSDPVVAASGVRWIDVDLSEQRVYAYEGDTIVNSFVVSTGTWRTPTVTGKFKVYIRLRSGDMRGPGYFLPDVPYIMYFHGDYGLHGTYWHNNFGTPMSHGCVNLSIDDAAWLYNWSSMGTIVNVHN
ncbi:MAG TPA: L,D-transpeptidase family protein [Anaerolineales bacterium]